MRVMKKAAKDEPVKRFITFYNAFIYGEEYTSIFTIYLTLTNPNNNFPSNRYKDLQKSFKFRSFTFDLSELKDSNDASIK